MKVPKFDEIAGSILAKRTSIEFQNARSDQYLKKSDSESLSKSLSSFENIPIEPIKKQITINTYRSRQNKANQVNSNQNSIINDSQESSSNDSKKYETFWNSLKSNVIYDNGIVYDKTENQTNKDQYIKDWVNEIDEIRKKIDKKEKETNENQKLQKFCSFNSSISSKLYKIFLYDEKNRNWTFQSDVFQVFAKDKHINVDDSITPIVFILDSYKDDFISLVSNLINGNHPNLDNEQDIFIYSLCDKSLAMLDYYVDFESKEKTSIKPIFLLLHIPKSKENLPNLHQIIFEIYIYLSIISDLEIIILNKNHYIDQLKQMKIIKEIVDSFKLRNKKNEDKNKYRNKDSSSEGSEEEESENGEVEEDIWDDKSINENVNNESLEEVRIKNAEIILLLNDQSVESSVDIEDDFEETEFFQKIQSSIDENDQSYLHFINVKSPDSYETFLYSFVTNLLCDHSKYSDVIANFNAIYLSKLNLPYVIIRNHVNDWKEYLKEMIIKLKAKVESKSTGKESPFVLISKLSNEISRISPSIDKTFQGECNLILSQINAAGSKINKQLFSNELQKSADSHLLFLKEKINDKFFWNEEQMDLITKNHFSFLKNEFYDIIQLTSSEKIYNMIYEDNYDILEEQMQKSKLKLNEVFKPYIEKIKIKNNPHEQNLKEKIKKGSNYCMKETENLREIKVTIQVNKDLQSEIKQDF